MTTLKRIGFCCKWLNDTDQVGGMKVNATDRELNGRSTTMRWLREHPAEAEQRQWDIMNHNTTAAVKMIERVATLPANRRMVRLGSEMLQGYTEASWIAWWQQPDIQRHLEKIFAPIGETARRLDVRLSFHPGQFCCIVSNNPGIVERSIAELEYHADMARWMGYGKSKLDFKINVHLSGKLGVDGFDAAWQQMSPVLRNCLTLENDEYQAGLDKLLPLRDRVGIVLDIHHHFINTGEYIQHNDPRIQQVIESWQGARPVIHYSQSRSEYVAQFDDVIPTMDQLLAVANKTKLRSHSDFYNNKKLNAWALTHLEWADIQTESKGKNLSAEQLFNQWQESI
jgi:UV DNA damage repair endonuclease